MLPVDQAEYDMSLHVHFELLDPSRLARLGDATFHGIDETDLCENGVRNVGSTRDGNWVAGSGKEPLSNGKEPEGEYEIGADSRATTETDYRRGTVSLEWFSTSDVSGSSQPQQSQSPSHGEDEGLAVLSSEEAKRGALGTYNLGHGLVRVFRRNVQDEELIYEDENFQKHRMACILSVPAYMTPADLLGFLGEHVLSTISHLRMVRANYKNRYLVLLKFRDWQDARDFRHTYNGRAFSALESEGCNIVFVSGISYGPQRRAGQRHGPTGLVRRGSIMTGPFLAENSHTEQEGSSKEFTAFKELPTCVVCLERMDACITGLVTTVCQHTFHCDCLKKWNDNSCPVCRYSQEYVIDDHGLYSASGACDNKCVDCGINRNLWICLICGNIACGRYDNAHAYAHYKQTSHLFALDLSSQRVWDYAGDEYVHRLIQNKADGKMVELPSNRASSIYENPKEKEKLQEIGMEYTYMLTEQLDSQRTYYEAELEKLREKLMVSHERLQDTRAHLDHVASKERADSERLVKRVSALELDSKNHKALEVKYATLRTVAKGLENQVKEEKSISDNLMRRIEALEAEGQARQAQLAVKDDKIKDLEEQLRDVMFTLSVQSQLSAAEPTLNREIREGQIVVPAEEKPATKSRNRRHR